MKPSTFFDRYDGEPPPWEIGRPQPAIEPLTFTGTVLDVGCGTGEHALLAASRGLTAVGVDTAPAAIELARAKAAARELDVRFEVYDALALGGLGERFDTVIDTGVFHVFDDEDRARYVESLTAATAIGGRLHVLVFSDKVPGGIGPRRISEAELRAAFASGWTVDAITESRFLIRRAPDGVSAWLASFTRT
jgi:cyclopropane fatty-acyl-phospholipid synthase-like methyltransferase